MQMYESKVQEAQSLHTIKSAASAKAELKSKAKQDALAELKKKREAAKAELSQAKAQLKEAKAELAEAKKAKEDLKSAERKVKSAEAQVVKKDHLFNVFAKKIEKAQKEAQEAKSAAANAKKEAQAASKALAQAEKDLQKAKQDSGIIADEMRESESKAQELSERKSSELEKAQKEAQAAREALAEKEREAQAARLLLAQARAKRGKASEKDLLLIWQATSAAHAQEASKSAEAFIKDLRKNKEFSEALKAASLSHKSPSAAFKLMQENYSLWAKALDLAGINYGKKENLNPSLISPKRLHPYLLAASPEGIKVGSLSLSGSCKPLAVFTPEILFKLLLWDKALKTQNISQAEQGLHLEILLKLSEALKAEQEAQALSEEAKKEAQAAREAFAQAQDVSKPCTISDFLKLAAASKRAKEREAQARKQKREAQAQARKAQSAAKEAQAQAQQERKAASEESKQASKEALAAAS